MTEERSTVRFAGFAVTVKEAWVARSVLVLTIVLSIVMVYLTKLINAWYAAFWNAVQERNVEVFWQELISFAILAPLHHRGGRQASLGNRPRSASGASGW